MSQTQPFLENKKVLIYQIDPRTPLSRDGDLNGTNISILKGVGTLSKVHSQIKNEEIEVLVTVGIDDATVKVINKAIENQEKITKKQENKIVLITFASLLNDNTKRNFTREEFLQQIVIRYNIITGEDLPTDIKPPEIILALNPSERDRRKQMGIN